VAVAKHLIDRNGKIWEAGDPLLLEALGYPDPDFELLSFAVRNMGAVSIDVGDKDITLSYRAQTASADALSAAAKFLAKLPPLPVSVRAESADWREHRFVSGVDALTWLGTQPAMAARNVIIEPRRLTAISDRQLSRLEMSDDYFALLFKKWRIAGGQMRDDVPELLVRFGLLDQTTIASREGNGQMVFDHVATKINIYRRHFDDGSWVYRMKGMPVSAQPDRDYATYVDSTFRRALDQNGPSFDHISAVISDRAGVTRHVYDRLLLPWRTEDGRQFVTCTAYVTAPNEQIS
jgi:hypothetical protein